MHANAQLARAVSEKKCILGSFRRSICSAHRLAGPTEIIGTTYTVGASVFPVISVQIRRSFNFTCGIWYVRPPQPQASQTPPRRGRTVWRQTQGAHGRGYSQQTSRVGRSARPLASNGLPTTGGPHECAELQTSFRTDWHTRPTESNASPPSPEADFILIERPSAAGDPCDSRTSRRPGVSRRQAIAGSDARMLELLCCRSYIAPPAEARRTQAAKKLARSIAIAGGLVQA